MLSKDAVIKAVADQIGRSDVSAAQPGATGSDIVAEAYLSGAMQTLHYLIANDGGTSPFEMRAVFVEAAAEMGFKLGHPQSRH